MKRIIIVFFLLASAAAFAQQQMEMKQNNYTSFRDRTKIISDELIKNTPEAFRSNPDFGLLPVNAPKDCFELLQKRTTSSRYYIKNNSGGKDFFIQQAHGPINFYDPQGNLRAIDYFLHPTDVTGIYEADAQPLPTKLDFVNNYTSIRVKDLDFRYNDDLKLLFQTGKSYSVPQYFNMADHTVGLDGAYIKNIWKGVDGEIAFRQGGIKTNFIIRDKSIVDATSDYLIIEEFIPLPAGFRFEKDAENGYALKNGDWKGNVELKNEFGLNLLRIERPIILDQDHSVTHKQDQVDAIAYELIPVDGGYTFRIKVNTKWLTAPERKYPVVIDPTLIGEATYTAGDIGFKFSAACWNDLNYCNYFLDITVPGKTTLTAAYFDGTYYSQNFGCFFVTDCLMSQAAFRILGPCDDSPSPAGFWTCVPPVGDSAGTCWGIDLDMFNTIACIPPQCADYNFTFEMRTFHCSCTKPPCDITCHYMPAGSWVITIEGKTVEEDPEESALHPDFTICEGDTIDLFADGNWGVPPYTYEWLPGGAVEDTHLVWPTTTTVYTAVIHDLCDMTDTVTQTVNVNPKPIVNIGPFQGCYSATLTAPATYADYVWTDANDSVIATGSNSITVDSTGTYYVTVTDAFGCSGTSSPIIANVYEAPVVDAFPDTVYVNDGALALLQVQTVVGGSVNYSWTPADQLTCPTCATTLAYAVGDENVYYVTGEEHGCVSAPDSIVVIMSQSELIIPNAFTPNDDGLNDVFHILNPIFYPVFSFEIYNRWGQQVFITDDILQGWDGTSGGKTQEIGMYVWMVTYEKANEPGKQYALHGTVTLLR